MYDRKDDLKKINDNHSYKSRAIGTINLEHGPASVKWVDLTCSEREARTASAKQQLVSCQNPKPDHERTRHTRCLFLVAPMPRLGHPQTVSGP